MRALMICVLLLAACGPSEQYKALEAERNALQRQLKEVSDKDRIQRIRTDAVSLMSRICSGSFDPDADIRIAEEIMQADFSQARLNAFKDDTSTLERVLGIYIPKSKEATAELRSLSDRLRQEQEALRAKEDDIKSSAGKVDANKFFPVNIILARKFDEKNGYSAYEAFDLSKNRKIVALVPNETEINVPHTLRSHARPLGDQPFQNTISNNFRSFERTDYLPVLQVANSVEAYAIAGSTQDIQKLRQAVALTEAKVTEARLEARSQVLATVAPMSSDIKRLADAVECSASIQQATAPAGPIPAEQSTSDRGLKSESKSTPGQLFEQCKRELKDFVVSEVGIFTKENDLAIGKRCRENPEQGLCFTKKVREAGGSISRAERGQIEAECGF
jgi:hypothetical protein